MKILCNLIIFFFFAPTLLFLLRLLLFKTGLIYVVKRLWRCIQDCFHVYQFFKVPEFSENSQDNQLYHKISIYLNSLTSIEDSDFTNLLTGKTSYEIILRLDPNQIVEDHFLGARVSWINSQENREEDIPNRSFVLGRVWKRSFLLYGPSGTGKSSFIAAMANFLCYDVYEIDLFKISDDSDLKMLLLQTTSKSVIVIEELDRFLADKSTAVSLSGILNFMDGILSSCCAEEKVMVFTMNGKDLVDQAILRPGRIDVHIHFPLCDFSAFKTLAVSYLGVKDHKLFPQVEEIFQNGASLSPAEISELMIANRNSPSRALKSVINALQTDGDRRGIGGIRRRFCENWSRKSAEEEVEEPSRVFCKEGGSPAVKEFRKLYGLLRMKSGNNTKARSFDLASFHNEG
ncbi:AAA-ATPase At2g46620 [Carica papaya]|uniref:AAA-ATPase At2g46620 n=1 Tax=Carica papaya TaxID=3649 RepID=UPI000B8CE0E7|nr:AAA-ATPase At2g46620 [Carica papaya]